MAQNKFGSDCWDQWSQGNRCWVVWEVHSTQQKRSHEIDVTYTHFFCFFWLQLFFCAWSSMMNSYFSSPMEQSTQWRKWSVELTHSWSLVQMSRTLTHFWINFKMGSMKNFLTAKLFDAPPFNFGRNCLSTLFHFSNYLKLRPNCKIQSNIFCHFCLTNKNIDIVWVMQKQNRSFGQFYHILLVFHLYLTFVITVCSEIRIPNYLFWQLLENWLKRAICVINFVVNAIIFVFNSSWNLSTRAFGVCN